MCPKLSPEQADPAKPALSMRETEKAIGLGHVATNAEVQSGRLKSYKVGRRRFTTPAFIMQWQADRIAESEQAGS